MQQSIRDGWMNRHAAKFDRDSWVNIHAAESNRDGWTNYRNAALHGE